MKTRTGMVVWGLILLTASLWSAAAAAPSAGPPAPRAQVEESAAPEGGPDKIYGAPRDIKEKIAILVFIAWMWLSICVLIYLIRLKIQEIDRLDRFDYFSARRKTPPPKI